MKINQLIPSFSLLVIVTANIMLLYFIYLMLYPFKTIEVDHPVKLVNGTEIKRGDELTFEMSYTKYINVHVDRSRYIVCDDGNLVTLSPDDIMLPLGKHIIRVNHFILPQKTSLSTCKVIWNAVYRVNPFREIVSTFESEKFKVIE